MSKMIKEIVKMKPKKPGFQIFSTGFLLTPWKCFIAVFMVCASSLLQMNKHKFQASGISSA